MAQTHGIVAIGTVSTPEKLAFAKAYGARQLILREPPSKKSVWVKAEVSRLTNGVGVDLVLDHVGGTGFTAQLELLAPLGTLLSYNALAGLPDENLLGAMRALLGKSLGVRCYSIHSLDSVPTKRAELMKKGLALMASGAVKAPRATLMPLSQAVQAHHMLDTGNTLGKIVLLPDDL